MIAAFVRGLLKPELKYGLRSRMGEDAVFEAMLAGVSADMHLERAANASSTVPALTPESAERVLKSVSRREQRAMELRLMDVYRMADSPAAHRRLGEKRLSLYRLYKIAEKKGIFDLLAREDCGCDESCKAML